MLATITAIALLAAPVTSAGAAEPTQPEPAEQQPVTAQAGPDHSVTLLTGDRVRVSADLTRTTITPAEGRHGITFTTTRVQDQLFVIPSDLRTPVATGRLDRRLFDVAGLVAAGYDDARTQSIPLVITYAGRSARAPLPMASSVRSLPAINGAAVKVAKKDAAGFLAGLGARNRSFANGVAKVWLDGRRKPTLDQSVPQIGTPAAWQAGYTGKGVKVAVLDTGIDATHPDLAGQVIAAKNFTEVGASDTVGHGTHVASTIAGTAKASDGRFKGVAPDAKLLDGKICDDFGCAESAILAGMEWAAVEQRAQVVNLSIGGRNTPELDPLEAAVNNLTASTGTLFVIAAGNSGYRPDGFVESPGSAAAALTVGAVDKQDKLADFSSFGPSLDGSAVKPDVTAPGVDIVAAKAKDSSIGEPVGTQYLKLSGTSMATPHAAGAAALLAQQHADWKAAELKAALMGSAKPAEKQTTFQQGAGRVDLARAVRRNVLVDPASLSFGKAGWPHDDDVPVAKELTYRNQGDQPIILQLATSYVAADGSPAPAEALKLSAATVTVPAKGTASVTVTSDTRHSGPDGVYSGRITATGGDAAIVTPLGVEKEIESHTLKLNFRDIAGQPGTDGYGAIIGLDNRYFNLFSAPDGTHTLRLPKGDYLIDTYRSDLKRDTEYQLMQPHIELDRDVTIDLDARLAKRVTASIDQPGIDLATLDFGFTAATEINEISTGGLLGTGTGTFIGQLGGVAPGTELVARVGTHWGVASSPHQFLDSPVTYSTVDIRRGEYFNGFDRLVRQRDLAKVVATHHRQADVSRIVDVYGRVPGLRWVVGPNFELKTAARVEQYLEAGEIQWDGRVLEIRPSPERPLEEISQQLSSPTRYQLGKEHRSRWNAAPLAPSFGLPGRATHDPDGSMLINVYGYSDQEDGHVGLAMTDSASTVVYRDGVKVAESDEFGLLRTDPLPAGKAQYKVVSAASRPSSVSALSTRSELTWTFTSASAAEVRLLPLRTVRFQPTVDIDGRADRTPVSVLPFRLETQAGISLPTAKKVELRVSGDEGKTWRKASVVPAGKGAYQAIFPTPAGATNISLKTYVLDSDGSTAEQTVISAYRLK